MESAYSVVNSGMNVAVRRSIFLQVSFIRANALRIV